MRGPARTPAVACLLLACALGSVVLTVVAPLVGVALATAAVIVAAVSATRLGTAGWVVVGVCALALAMSIVVIVTSYDAAPHDACPPPGCEEQYDVTPVP